MKFAILTLLAVSHAAAAAGATTPGRLAESQRETTPSSTSEATDAATLEAVWPGLAEAGRNRSSGAPSEAMPALLIDALSGGEPPDAEEARLARDADEARLARDAVAIFNDWAGRSLPPPPGFRDAELPAPEAWVARQLPRVLGEEARLLASALDAATDEEATERARELVRQRFRRVAMLHDRDVVAWRRAELRDGLPLYVAYRALVERAWAEAGDRPEPREDPSRLSPLARRMRASLEDTLTRATGGAPDAFTPAISGFGLALLLDKSRPGWPALLVERNTSLDVLLAGPPRHFGNRPVRAPASSAQE